MEEYWTTKWSDQGEESERDRDSERERKGERMRVRWGGSDTVTSSRIVDMTIIQESII